MTEREYQRMLDVVEEAINGDEAGSRSGQPGHVPTPANDNRIEWPLLPFPEGWTASP